MMSGSVPKKLFTALITRKSRRTKEAGAKRKKKAKRGALEDGRKGLGPSPGAKTLKLIK